MDNCPFQLSAQLHRPKFDIIGYVHTRNTFLFDINIRLKQNKYFEVTLASLSESDRD